ncbi:MAG: DUF1572 family protein [Ginsengibacter sp.]
MNIADLYERDLEKLAKEISLYKNENDLWKAKEGIINPGGNLAVHIIGSVNYFVGSILGNTGYVRDRDGEFSVKNISREQILADLENAKKMAVKVLSAIPEEEMKKEYPIKIAGQTSPVRDTLVFFLAHLNYHLGQLNYLRRMIDN